MTVITGRKRLADVGRFEVPRLAMTRRLLSSYLLPLTEWLGRLLSKRITPFTFPQAANATLLSFRAGVMKSSLMVHFGRGFHSRICGRGKTPFLAKAARSGAPTREGFLFHEGDQETALQPDFEWK